MTFNQFGIAWAFDEVLIKQDHRGRVVFVCPYVRLHIMASRIKLRDG